MAIVAAILLPFRSSFYRMSGFSELRLSPAWFAMVLAGVAAATWLGFFSYRHVEYSNQLWWQFEWNGNAPRFLRATVAVCAVLVWAAVAFLIHRPPAVRFRPDPVSDVVRRLVAAAPQTQPNVALLGDKKFLIAEDESAFLMYGRSGRSWISMGDPVGGGPAAVELIWRLRELADRNGGRTIYYAVSPGLPADIPRHGAFDPQDRRDRARRPPRLLAGGQEAPGLPLCRPAGDQGGAGLRGDPEGRGRLRASRS